METFRMTIVRDKAKPWQEDIKEICDGLRNRGYTPHGFDRDDNFFHIGGTVGKDEGCTD